MIKTRLPNKVLVDALIRYQQSDSNTAGRQTHNHWVRMTSVPSCSEVVPGRGSYRDKPIAWIWIFFFVDASFKKVRYKPEINPTGAIHESEHTRTRAGKKPLCLKFKSQSSLRRFN